MKSKGEEGGAVTKSKSVVKSRYAQLTPEKRAALVADVADVSLHPGLNSYTGPVTLVPYFKKAFEQFRASCAALSFADALCVGFVEFCNSPDRRSTRSFEAAMSQMKNGFILFIISVGMSGLQLYQIDTEVVNAFIHWLKTASPKGKVLSSNTQRKYYGTFKEIFEILSVNSKTRLLVSQSLVFHQNPFPGAHDESVPTEVIDDVTMRALQRACVGEIKETMDAVQNAWSILGGEFEGPDFWKRGRGQYSDYSIALWGYSNLFNLSLGSKNVPFLDEVRERNKDLADSLQYLHGFKKVCNGVFPTASEIFPFVTLLAIYSFSNSSGLRGLKISNIVHTDVVRKRILMTFEKPRAGGTHRRSFAVDEDALVSPGELVKFIEKWTARIRPLAGIFHDHLFIFATNLGGVRAFFTAKDTGTDSDSLWNNAANAFFKRHGLPKINLKGIRFSAADTVRQIENDDARAVQAILGQKSRTVNEQWYDAAGAKRRRNEALSEAMNSLHGWARTGGRIDIRTGGERVSSFAATPGFDCFDPYDSPIAGEILGRKCEAFGQCPECPSSFVNRKSAYSLARMVQLYQLMSSSMLSIDMERWKDVYEKNFVSLRQWIESYTDTDVIEESKRMELNPLPPLD